MYDRQRGTFAVRIQPDIRSAEIIDRRQYARNVMMTAHAPKSARQLDIPAVQSPAGLDVHLQPARNGAPPPELELLGISENLHWK
jgi:hypothetical protein